ncbi:MAG: arginine deiminase [Propionibacteriaceae bacterium]|nr:arginine deiminase [Propionibacteriaceae bacterium]
MVDSEVGRLRTVLVHRPGRELQRLTPRNNDRLLFDGVPWVARAQEEHDAFVSTMESHGVEVLQLTDLLTETLAHPDARAEVTEATLRSLHLGTTLRRYLTEACAAATPAELTDLIVAGIRNDEVRGGHGLVTALLAPHDFLVDPLPNLVFTRDSSVWIGDRVAITSLAMPARVRETQLTELIWTHHPRFRDVPRILGSSAEPVEGGDVLLLAPGVVAVGVGQRTNPAGAERLARQLFAEGLAHTLLAVPVDQTRATMHLDTVLTMVDVDTVVMYPNIADRLQAWTVTPGPGFTGDGEHTLTVDGPAPFAVAAGRAMGIDRLRVIDTGTDAVIAEREQWDDGNNTLALAPRLAIAYERNIATNERLTRAGIEVIPIAGSELGSGRGGPRCMSCPIERDPLGN